MSGIGVFSCQIGKIPLNQSYKARQINLWVMSVRFTQGACEKRCGRVDRIPTYHKGPIPKTSIIALSFAILAGSLVSAKAETAKVTGKPDAAVTEQITAKLAEEGYEVRKVETEDGLYEAYALKNGEKSEIFMDAALTVVRTKSE